MEKGKLYICPTPIGNLGDITLRTLEALREVDLIAAEDTRHTIKLLNHYEIKKPLTSYHQHNRREKGTELIGKLNDGVNIALVSDAGMPGISDPGEELIRAAIDEGIEVIALPGPTASITALLVSGLPTDQFTFYGFLSPKKKERQRELREIEGYKATSIIYEAPHRILGLLEDMADILADRRISISRELTKRYEETFRGTVGEALEAFRESPLRGEFVIVIEGNTLEAKEDDIDIEGALRAYLDKGYTKKEAVGRVAREYNLPKNQVYKVSLEIGGVSDL
ncbi:MAG: 16S rRNA (cytidine(1402)-2'-O)-methyltransferase [Tissierellaceae bacterium]|nr:16S rRNA (cytidine(1402)-2'-O)-methyltransferase [Tissierellaceae bacterium]